MSVDNGKKTQATRKRPGFLRALGADSPPQELEVNGERLTCVDIMKHDSWAATAIYASDQGRKFTCKFGRRVPVGPIPLAWVGRALSRREAGFLDRLGDLDLVPANAGPVSIGGQVTDNAVARHFVEGEPFCSPDQLHPDFFPQLNALIEQVHARGVAYVDLHKGENIIIDEQGRPNLIDFQVSFAAAAPDKKAGPIRRRILAALQDMDRYHVNKFILKYQPELLTDEQVAAIRRRPWIVRAHRSLIVPLRQGRRRLLAWLGVRNATGSARSELEPEAAFRSTPDA